MATPILYGIKNCDTVRKARKWLDNNGISYQFCDIRNDGLAASTLDEWLVKTDLEVLVNKRSTTWKQLSEAERNQLFDTDPTAILQQYPTLIKRPVLCVNDTVTVGFKETDYKRLLLPVCS